MQNVTLFNQKDAAMYAEFRDILEELEENGGEMTEEMYERFNINKSDFIDRVEFYAKIIDGNKADVGLLTDKIAFYQQRIKAKETNIEKLKEFIKIALNAYGESSDKTSGKKLKTSELTAWTVYNKPLVIEDEDDFNDERFINFSISNKLNQEQLDKVKELFQSFDVLPIVNKSIEKKKLKDHLEQTGENIEGVSLDKEASFLQLRTK